MLTINRKEFTDAFLAAASCVSSRTTIDIIKNVLVVAKNGEVTFTATDSENEIQVVAEGDSKEPMRFAIPADRFSALLKEVDGDQLTISVSERVADVSCGDSNYKIPLVDPDAFPNTNNESGVAVGIPGSRLIECLRRTVVAIDEKNTKYNLGGIEVAIEDSRVVFVGTDTRRIGVDIIPAECESGLVQIIPRKLCQLLLGVIDPTQQVRLSLLKNRLIAKQGDHLTVSGKYLAGLFPRWTKVVKENPQFNGKVQVPPKQFASVIRRALVTSATESRGVTVTFTEKEISVENQTADVGRSRAKMPCSYSGPETSVLILGDFILDALGSIGEPIVDIGIVDHLNPVVFSCGSYRHAIMPLYLE